MTKKFKIFFKRCYHDNTLIQNISKIFPKNIVIQVTISFGSCICQTYAIKRLHLMNFGKDPKLKYLTVFKERCLECRTQLVYNSLLMVL